MFTAALLVFVLIICIQVIAFGPLEVVVVNGIEGLLKVGCVWFADAGSGAGNASAKDKVAGEQHKLRKRRDKLEIYSFRYYYALAENVAVNGSMGREHFEVEPEGDAITINVFRFNSNGHREVSPYYKRIFTRRETKRITLQGFGGGDTFDIGKDLRGISIRTIK